MTPVCHGSPRPWRTGVAAAKWGWRAAGPVRHGPEVCHPISTGQKMAEARAVVRLPPPVFRPAVLAPPSSAATNVCGFGRVLVRKARPPGAVVYQGRGELPHLGEHLRESGVVGLAHEVPFRPRAAEIARSAWCTFANRCSVASTMLSTPRMRRRPWARAAM